MLRDGGPGLREQLTLAFRLTLARPPQTKELKILEATFREQHARFTAQPADAESLLAIGDSPRPRELDAAALAAMPGVANVLLNLNETITK